MVPTGTGQVSAPAAAWSTSGSSDDIRRTIRTAEWLLRAIIGCEVPVVAAVHGPAIGVGATLAVLSDLVVMADDTFLSTRTCLLGSSLATGAL